MLTHYGRDIQNVCNRVLGRICSSIMPLESRVRCVAYSTSLRLATAKQVAKVSLTLTFGILLSL
jgi:hypothetical protein